MISSTAAKEDAETLHKAMKGLGTNEKMLISVFGYRSREHLQQVQVEYQKLYNKMHKAYGSSTFLKHVQNFTQAYGLPEDVSTLLLILDTKDPATMLTAIDKLKDLFVAASAREKEDIRRKLSIIGMTDRSSDVKERAREVAEELKSV